MLKPLQFWQDLRQRLHNQNTATESPAIDIWRYAEPATEEPNPCKRNLLQWRRAISAVPDPIATFAGQPVDLVGFVWRSPTDPASQCLEKFGGSQGNPDSINPPTFRFTLARRVIRCCLADTVPLGLPVYTTATEQFETDSWLHIQGVLISIPGADEPSLAIAPSYIELISEPPQPYINGVF